MVVLGTGLTMVAPLFDAALAAADVAEASLLPPPVGAALQGLAAMRF